jgi:ATP-dependent helicase/nuclease subunit A
VSDADAFDRVQLDRVIARQRAGADARANAWVSASAGAGKTRVLRDRVLRLLLAGVAPQRILCLTFTKAAAAEMARRINAELGDWTVADDSALADRLSALLGAAPDAAETRRARQLFARVLESPGGMKIMTIHAFCQSVLRRFPLEAGVVPHFQVLEERDAAELRAEAQAQVLAAAQNDDGPLGAAVDLISTRVHETLFPKLMGEVAASRTRFAGALARSGGIDGVLAGLAARFGVPADIRLVDVLDDACRDAALDREGLARLVVALDAGSDASRKLSARIAAWLESDLDVRVATFAGYSGIFLTDKGQPRDSERMTTKAVRAAMLDAADTLAREADRLLAVHERLRKAELMAANAALLRIAAELVVRYDQLKAERGRLDFDDLIVRTRALLQGDGAAAWVLFKLDGGIDHVLVDEAQDTNPEQWDVILALVEEFFAGLSARDETVEEAGLPARSVFAVGDVKQSIYSFQGADPSRFETVRAYLAGRAAAARRDWNDVALDFSFRSARPVLEAVDRVFADPAAGDGVVDAGKVLLHTPLRAGAAGLVELWPPVCIEKADPPEPWKPPVEPVSQPGEGDILANLIADRVARWLADGERLDSAGREMRPGDIMVLVRRRDAFVETLVRAFKQRGVPVSGVDRMVLTEQIAVMDLIAMGALLLLPEDDLTLASVLKGPLIGFDEETLFDLAHGRGAENLWHTLGRRRGENPAFAAAHAALSDLLARVDFERPHELYAGLLARGGRARLFARLGPEAVDPVDEFMSLALTYERGHAPSLQGFLHWIAAGEAEVKRDLDHTEGAVRIMTVHGAKGLEAPVVFLPDTTRLPRQFPAILWDEAPGDGGFVWLPRVGDADEGTAVLREAVRARQRAEYRRLLYVAMTRAEERLYVCGAGTPEAGSWYALVEPALAAVGQEIEDPLLAGTGIAAPHVLRLAASQRGPVPEAEVAVAPTPVPLPDWALRPPPDEPDPPRPLAPSDPGDDPPVRAPIGTDIDAARFQRGTLMHRLLQLLPDLPADARRAAAMRFLSRPGFGLDAAMCDAFVDEAMAVLDAPEFAHLFGPDSLAEVAITGTAAADDGSTYVISGQIDRLAVTADAVAIVDYKSNRPPPDDPLAVAPVYLRQMAAYRHIVRAAWPDRAVTAYLLWTDGPRLMPLPESLLDAHAPQAVRSARTRL